MLQNWPFRPVFVIFLLHVPDPPRLPKENGQNEMTKGGGLYFLYFGFLKLTFSEGPKGMENFLWYNSTI